MKATLVGTYALVDAQHKDELNKRRIYGVEEGAGVRLALEELSVGVDNGFLQLDGQLGEAIINATPQRRARLRVFRDLWERGYVVTFGSKFGADFLIYKDDPKRSHAVAIIVVKGYEEQFARVDVVSFCRMAKMIKKRLLFACVRPCCGEECGEDEESKDTSEKDSVVYISLTHALLVSRQDEIADEALDSPRE